MTRRFRRLLIGAVAILTLATAALVLTVGTAVGSNAQKGKKIEFNVLQIELKGSTTTDKLAPPTVNPTTLSDGYGYKKPGEADPAAPTKWEVAAYTFAPGFMTACKGDTVVLRLFAINGDEHLDWVEAPNGDEVVKERSHNRGRQYVVSFKAKQTGVYTLICNKHEPTMKAQIRVLPTC